MQRCKLMLIHPYRSVGRWCDTDCFLGDLQITVASYLALRSSAGPRSADVRKPPFACSSVDSTTLLYSVSACRTLLSLIDRLLATRVTAIAMGVELPSCFSFAARSFTAWAIGRSSKTKRAIEGVRGRCLCLTPNDWSRSLPSRNLCSPSANQFKATESAASTSLSKLRIAAVAC